MGRGLRVPVAAVFGEAEGLPALSCRGSDFTVVHAAAPAAAAVVVVALPAACQAVELAVENDSDDPVLFRFVATSTSDGATAALLDAKGFRRRIPSGAQLNETRAVDGGDYLVFQVSAAVRVTVHAHGTS